MTSTKTTNPSQVSTGAGIAIAGTWLAGAATTITILLISFVFAPSNAEMSPGGAILLIAMIAAPMVAAYSVTKMILGRDGF